MRTLILSVVLATSVAAASASVPKMWKQQYKSVMKTIEAKDMAGFKGFFDPSFVNIDDKGKKSTREEFFEVVSSLFEGAASITAKEKLKDVKANGELVDVSFDLIVVIKKQSGTTKFHEVGVDTWKKVGGRWVMVKTVDSSFTLATTKSKKPALTLR